MPGISRPGLLTLYAVNALLKQPLFEIKEIGLEEIQRLEKELAKLYSYEEDYE